MAVAPENLDEPPTSKNPNNVNDKQQDNDIESDDESEPEPEPEDDLSDEDEELPEIPATREAIIAREREVMAKFKNKMGSGAVTLRVHDVIIKGNSKTKDYLIEAEVMDALKHASSLQEIIQASSAAYARLRQLGIFDSVNIVVHPGPPELPGTANVVVEVSESKTLSSDIGMYTKPGARSWSVEGILKLKNLLGYADMWDGAVSYGWDQTTEISAGVALPMIRHWATPTFVRTSLSSRDWIKFSSYKEHALGLGVGLLSTRNHDLAYNLTWRTLTDPSQMAGMSVRRQLGHSLLSTLKYTFKVDNRNSAMRPTRGYAYSFTTLLAGLNPDSRSARFLREEFDFRYVLPLGFYRAAINFGVSAGVIFPWGQGFLDRPSPIPDRFFMGGNSSPICSLGGPNTLWGFKWRGLGPSGPRRQAQEKPDGDAASERDALGGDVAVSGFADLSFDLPLRVLREAGIHGHVFASAGNLVKLTENEWRGFSVRDFMQSFRSSVGCGIIVPTKLFRVEVNYCHILRQYEHDHGKTGVQFSFSAP